MLSDQNLRQIGLVISQAAATEHAAGQIIAVSESGPFDPPINKAWTRSGTQLQESLKPHVPESLLDRLKTAIEDRKSTRLNSVTWPARMPSSACKKKQNVKDRVHDPAVARLGAIARRRHQRFKKNPLRVGQIKSHEPRPITLKHALPRSSRR